MTKVFLGLGFIWTVSCSVESSQKNQEAVNSAMDAKAVENFLQDSSYASHCLNQLNEQKAYRNATRKKQQELLLWCHSSQYLDQIEEDSFQAEEFYQ